MSEQTPTSLVARLVHYTGRVQGVGFRATVAGMARSFALTGYVRNLADGRVQLLVQGTEAEVQRFLQAVRDEWQGYIRDEQVETRPPNEQLTRLTIVH
jgi:acylphosphatase